MASTIPNDSILLKNYFLAADGIGGCVKNKVSEKMLMAPDTVMRNVEDIKANIETSINMTIHTKEDIQKLVEVMPKKIGALVGATKIHEIVFESDKIKKKNLPNECSYQPVKIKIGRQIIRQREEIEPGREVLAEMPVIDLDDAILEPGRESLRVRRRRAALADVMDDLEDDLESEFDDE